MKKKGKIRMVILGIVIFLVVGMGGALLFTEGERREGKNLSIDNVDFKKLNDGTYIGEYEGGKYKWRANKAKVTVKSNKVTDIEIVEDKVSNTTEIKNKLFQRVIDKQSLQVDTISGATITSKAYLKSIENALKNAKVK